MAVDSVFDRIRLFFRNGADPVVHGAVVDTSNDTLIALGTFAPILQFIQESLMDSMYVPYINSKDTAFIKLLGPRSYPEWSWNSSSSQFEKTNSAVLTEELRERAILVAKKATAASYVMYSISRERGRLNTGFLFQESIYSEKARQARMLKDTNYDQNLSTLAPYVAAYASENGITLQQSSEEILLQNQLDHEFLAKTEKIRLALMRKIRLAKTSEEIDNVVSAYRSNGTV